MKRNALLLGLGLGLVALAAPGFAADDVPTYDWGVAYYMSYDNNLERCGKPILRMIEEGVKSEKQVVAIQADFSDEGLHRYVVKSTGKEEKKLESDASANEDEMIAYFEWFAKTYKCKKYVFTFLNHGGRLDDMCQDAKFPAGGKEWMSGKVVGEKLRALKAKLPGKLELLFLQQCGRGSLENLYSFRGTAEYVMASPIPVGAPNTYYAQVHKWLAENPNATGTEIADKIAETDDHYTIYTCLKTEKLEELPKRLDAALAPFVATKDLVPPARWPKVIHPVGEPIVDARKFLSDVASVNTGVGTAEVESFFKWTREELFTSIKFHERHEAKKDELCGLSIYAPLTPKMAAAYKRLDLYSAAKNLPELWKKIAVRPERGSRKRDTTKPM